ncbi:MAG: DNRLRE domain-containing protein [Gemmatimonadales bacterium]
MLCPPPVYSLLTALALGTSGCDRQYPLAAEARSPQAAQQARDSALAPIADTYIRQGNPNQNQGTEPILRLTASGKHRALVRWDRAAIAGVVGADSLVAARLELVITHNADNWGAAGRTIDLHRLTQAWTETGATWNCADDTNPGNSAADCSGATAWAMDGPDPRPYATTPTASRLMTNGLGGVVTFDVTADVRAIGSGGGAQHGWIVKKTDDGASGQVEFGSREGGSAPRLVVTIASADTSRPPIPQTLDYPRDTTRLVQEPGDTVAIYYRTLAFVYFDDSTSGSTVRAFLGKYGAEIVGGSTLGEGYIVQFPDPGMSWDAYVAVLTAMQQEPGVETVAPLTRRDHFPGHDGRYPADGPGFTRAAWFDTTSAFTWALKAVRAPLAWGCETGAYDAQRGRIGVVEVEFDTALADLRPSSPQLFTASVVPGTQVAQVLIDEAERHASSVTSVLTASGDTLGGMAGMTWRTDLRLYALATANTLTSENTVAAFIREILPRVIADRPNVLNISLRFGRHGVGISQLGQLRRELRRFLVRSPNTLIVKSSGNEDSTFTPQGMTQRQGSLVALHSALVQLVLEGRGDRIMFVTGTERGNRRWSNHPALGGANVITGITEIAAPAESVGALGLRRAGEGVVLRTGTSLAGPLVAGVAAQLWAMDPNLTPGHVRDYILRGAREPRLDPTTGQLVSPQTVAGAPGVYQLDAYGALTLLSRERADAPICGLPVSAQVHVEPVGIRIGTRPVLPVPNLWALTSVAQGGRLIAAQVVGDTALEVRILNHHGNSLATLAPNILERQFLERDSADLVAGGVQLPNGFSLPELVVHRNDGHDTTIQLFPNLSLPPDLNFVFGPLVAVSPAGDAAATVWGYATGTPPSTFRWELVSLPSGTVTPVAQESPAGFVTAGPGGPPAWSHDGRRVVFPIIRANSDQEFSPIAVRTQLAVLFGAGRTDDTVGGRELFDPRFSPDDVVLHSRERERELAAPTRCWLTRRNPVAPHALLAPQEPLDCSVIALRTPPPEIFPNVRVRSPIAVADAARVRGSSRPRAGTLPRQRGWVQAN